MESTQAIKRRIRAVSNTSQITKAMEMVSANKMRKSQEVALASRPFAIAALKLLGELSARTPYLPALMERRAGGPTLVLVVAADKGLAGPFNGNVFRRAEKELFGAAADGFDKLTTGEMRYAAVGKKAFDFLERKGVKTVRYFTNLGDHAEPEETAPLADFLSEGFLRGDWSRVRTLSTHFRTTLRQDVIVRDLLPVDAAMIKRTVDEILPESGRYSGKNAVRLRSPQAEEDFFASSLGGSSSGGKGISSSRSGSEDPSGSRTTGWEYLVEPSPEEVQEELSRELVRITVHHLVLEANASEHSARMVAMKNASDNASDLKDELSLLFNTSRQAGITREIAEITAGAELLQQH
ncbi:MAG: ATP synthase F1 subunit gamma [bacterium]|nr:ATP synthase F1 subunit gamma [bacterium]